MGKELVNADTLVDAVKELDNNMLMLLSAKLSMPRMPLTELSKDLFPELTPSSRRALISNVKLTYIVNALKDNPSLAATLLSVKLMPHAVLTLNKLMSSELTRSNVRVTAAKELIRYAESSIDRQLREQRNSQARPIDNIVKLLDTGDNTEDTEGVKE